MAIITIAIKIFHTVRIINQIFKVITKMEIPTIIKNNKLRIFRVSVNYPYRQNTVKSPLNLKAKIRVLTI